ncbi:MAG: flagellar hook-length control protein FliK [Planctomycetota bacterium]|nr:MAG: flagellar hook-length control protein FliK [Planctomycetota bacterium]
MSQQLREGSARFVMRLRPAELGEIRVEMHLRGERVALNIDTHNELAHRLLRQDEHTLRHGLEAAGVHVEHLEVRPPAAASENAQAGMQQQPDPHDAEQDGSARRDAERPDPSGTESPTNVEAPERVDDMVSEVAAESRVDVLA